MEGWLYLLLLVCICDVCVSTEREFQKSEWTYSWCDNHLLTNAPIGKTLQNKIKETSASWWAGVHRTNPKRQQGSPPASVKAEKAPVLQKSIREKLSSCLWNPWSKWHITSFQPPVLLHSFKSKENTFRRPRVWGPPGSQRKPRKMPLYSNTKCNLSTVHWFVKECCEPFVSPPE